MGSTKIEAPSQPTTTSSVNDWANNLPTVYENQLKYDPLIAQQQVALAQQYAGPLGKAMQDAQSALYPETTALQENLAKQAREGITSDVPDWMKAQYKSNVNAQLGNNVNSPIGADYMSRGLLQQQQDWKQYYQNLGLSATGRQPLSQAQAPNQNNYTQGFTPGSVMQSNNQAYGTAANIFGTQQNAATTSQGQWLNLIGSGLGAAGTVAQAGAFSSNRYKKDIKRWE